MNRTLLFVIGLLCLLGQNTPAQTYVKYAATAHDLKKMSVNDVSKTVTVISGQTLGDNLGGVYTWSSTSTAATNGVDEGFTVMKGVSKPGNPELSTGRWLKVPIYSGSSGNTRIYVNGVQVQDPNLVSSSTSVIATSSTTNVSVNPTNLSNAQIAANAAIALTKLAAIANGTVLGNSSGSSASPSALTVLPVEVMALIDRMAPSVLIGAGGQRIEVVSGTPEGTLSRPVGSIAVRSDGGSGTTLYIKETGSGNTGWRVIGIVSGSGGVAGTLINTIASTAGSLAVFLDTTGTNTAPSTNLTVNATGDMTARSYSSGITTNGFIRVWGEGGGSLTITNNSTNIVRLWVPRTFTDGFPYIDVQGTNWYMTNSSIPIASLGDMSAGYILGRLDGTGSGAPQEIAYIPDNVLQNIGRLAAAVQFGGGGQKIFVGTDSPEGAVSLPVGSFFLRSNGGTGSTAYIKEGGGSGNTGWVAIAPGEGGSGGGVDFNAYLQTTDDTETNIWTYTMATNSTVTFTATEITAAGATNKGGFGRKATFYRVDTGAATQIGTNTWTESKQTGTGLEAFFDASGNDVRLRVKGKASENINWAAQGFRLMATNGEPAPPPGGYVMNFTTFDGTDRIQTSADLTGATDGKVGTVSIWFQRTRTATEEHLFAFAGAGGASFSLYIGSGGEVIVDGLNAASTTVLRLRTLGTVDDLNVHHVAMSWNLGVFASWKVYLDGVSSVNPSLYTDDTIDYTPGWATIGSRGDSFVKFAGKIGDPYFAKEFLDLDTEIDKFIDGSGNPVDLGADGSNPTGNPALVFLPNPFGTFGTNAGTGGNYDQFPDGGALTTGGTYP